MSNHKNLVFFNKEGDYLNFNYSEANDRFEGDILFHESSSDTYKTAGLYMLESVPSIDYEVPGELGLLKFQLFNEYGLHFYAAKSFTQSITKIEPINNDSSFYSKWIYGIDFESKFPIGSIIKFDSVYLEFTDLNKTYCVVGSKKNAIMIISEIDNASFESLYYTTYTDVTTYVNKTISGANLVGVYNYIDNSFNNNLSGWSEPDFYDKYYIGKKLNIVGSENNDGIVTVTNVDVTDQVHFEYFVSDSSLPIGTDILIEVITKTDLPKIYESGITITGDNKIKFDTAYLFPRILKPGTEFKITGSVFNDIFFTVSDVTVFESVNVTKFYSLGEQVYYNNLLFQCIQAYTHSHSSDQTRNVTPYNTNYWSKPDYVTVDQSTTSETILNGQVYLTSDRYYFAYGYTYSQSVTLASAAEKFKNDLLAFNIDLFYLNGKLKADLKYPSKYSEVNFYHTQKGPTYSIGGYFQTNERMVQVRENLNYELNYNYSSNFKYNIVFTDIDEFGIKLILNKQVYEEEISYVYTGLVIDMPRTIDRTLRNWLSRNYIRLYVLGIEAELAYIGSFYSPFYNAIKLKTTYPNVPLNINNVLVGSTADYHIEHSRVMFYDLGPYLNLNINGDDYGISTVYGTGSIPDVSSTLTNWVNEHGEILAEYKIIVKNYNNLLKFDVKEMDRRLDYTISTGKLKIPGINDYVITDKLPGSLGMLISSNQITLTGTGDSSFELDGFATGMVVTINNTFYPYNNQQYNIQFLDPLVMDLSYEGPFWSIGDAICNSSAFVTLAFNLGFGQTGCQPIVGPTGGTGSGGPFDPTMFSLSMFSLSYNPNVYTLNTYNLNAYPGVTGLVDIIYIQLSESIYGFGDNVVVLDSYSGDYITTVNLPGNTQSIEIEFNTVNNYLYCLSEQQINVVDPLLNTLVTTISLTSSNPSAQAFDMLVNPLNGDVYVTYKNWARVDIFASNNLTSSPSDFLSTSSVNFPVSATRTGKMVYNEFEVDIYITTDVDTVLRVNGGGVSNGTNRTIQTTFGIPGLTHSIFYEPVNESIYVYGGSSLWKIDNGVTQSIPSISTYGFNDILFNNLTGVMNVSDTSTNFSRLDLNTNVANQTSVSNYGYIELNQFDGDVYLSSQSLNNIIVVKSTDGTVIQTLPMAAQTTRLVYNPDRKSIWAIQPSLNSVIEVQVQLNSLINILPATYSQLEDNQYGTLSPDYVPRQNLWLKTDEYLRRPRENFEGEVSVKYYYKWLSDNIPMFFLYDISGEQLPTTGPYAYTGQKPLENPSLNRLPNKDVEKTGDSEYQQTIFDKVEYTLSYLDDEDDVTIEVTPIETFIGFKSDEEGAFRSILQLYKKEDIEISFTASATTYLKFETVDIENLTGDKKGIITLVSDSETFTGKGLKNGQWIAIYVKDTINVKNQYISENNGILVKIREIYTKYIIIDFFNNSVDFLVSENTRVLDYPSISNTTYLITTIKVIDKEIGRFFTYGQTEIEDPRFKIELSNVGKLIAPNEVFIFKDYDIFEGATDWTFLNAKRKEMLMMKNLIFPYIGAYKSLINSINYFGYNDLQLNEYYRDINTSSPNFGKLFKVEIPDIFDNTVEGWKETDFIKGFSTDNYEVTNSFNLTYFITDKDGNNILTYSLDEIIIKLQGLKYWLKRNIIPITHKILDITGRAYNSGSNYIKHRVQEIRVVNMKDSMTPITFNMNETYLMPVNSGSTVYNCVVDFYSIVPLPMTQSLYDVMDSRNSPIYNSPRENKIIPKPYSGQSVDYPDYFNLKIRTYKTYPEWNPFQTYDFGENVTYFGSVYQSATQSNKLKNPRKYDDVQTFQSTNRYTVAEVVRYSDEVYVFSGLGSTYSATQSAPTPLIDSSNWLRITEWKKINLQPVQYITEYRKGNDLRPFNFSIDSNIDPFCVIELTTDNGYGCVYTQKKNYEIRGLKDITQSLNPVDPIGPFSPIAPVY
jgi:hypothetical protein